MNFVFRPLDQEKDLALHVRLMNEFHPEKPRTEAEQRVEFDQWPPGSYTADWVMELDGLPVATCCVFDMFWASAPGRYSLDWCGNSVEIWEAALNHCLAHAKELNAKEISAWSTTLHPELSRFLLSHGFKLIEQAPVTELDVDAFDATRFRDRVARAESTGYRFCSAAELEREGVDWPALIHSAVTEIRQDMPGADDASDYTLEDFRRDIAIGGDLTHPRQYIWMALDGDRMAAYSRLQPSQADPTVMHTGLSGTVRSDRRKGLVTALKIKGIETARSNGVKRIQTDNLDQNPMLQLNLELGYRQVYVHEHYRLYFN